MATVEEKAMCVLWFFETKSVITTQRRFRTTYKKDPPSDNSIRRWLTQFQETAVRDEPDPFDEMQLTCLADLGIDEEYKSFYSEKKSPYQMRIKLKAAGLNSDCYVVCDRAAIAIASCVPQDFGLVTKTVT
ncbi:hypothetical protein AVEN_221555-1 [Araneus ventricosus]|uniref:DUF4817 domain-containing protein n=1 Tax=Araneus ventricosus TaxID=182803 RepID=A0A4Y2F7J4_ARAVE|nr:hypothetical protein AVEN_221555-1 [Araneus ventricosus]